VKLHWQIFIGMLLGAVVGVGLNVWGSEALPADRLGELAGRLGGLFLRLLQLVSVPLIVTSLAAGIMGLSRDAGDTGLRRLFLRTLAYYIASSLLAILVGLTLVNLIRPGLRSELPDLAPTLDTPLAPVPLPEVLLRQLEALVPTNLFAALAAPNFLGIIAFTLVFSIFAVHLGGEPHRRLLQLVEDLQGVMLAVTMGIIRLAPAGVLLLMLSVTASQGVQVFVSLGWYLGTVLLGLLIHAAVVLPLLLWFLAGRSALSLARVLSPALLTAFSSASSSGALPLSLTCLQKGAGVSNRTSSFVLPLGSTINMDGTALYEVVAVLFIAQLVHGEVTLAQQLVVVLTALLASIGAAGIPHAGLVMMVIILQAVNLPLELQGVVLAVDRVLDMGRTTVNVWSDCVGATILDRFEAR